MNTTGGNGYSVYFKFLRQLCQGKLVYFISLLENMAFKDLQFHKVFTYAFNLRPHLFSVLQKCGFKEEARLSEHCYFNGKYIVNV